MSLGKGKKHIVELPYIEEFEENITPTKARTIQMNVESMGYCKKEINDFLAKNIIRPL